ncbi:hypothetical protein [Furfurilactobacillus entadae]|uniref:hypothetical protein n=1 Tax=Furfurilactobacillus entadae TaxID=2922307 RepID=UPI0035ED0651
MLDVIDSIHRLQWTVDHHYAHIEAQHDFMRAWAVQFELAYTDFRVIQMALQLSGEKQHPLLKQFAAQYEEIYKYEYVFAGKGLDAFNDQFGRDLSAYKEAVGAFDETIQAIIALQ